MVFHFHVNSREGNSCLPNGIQLVSKGRRTRRRHQLGEVLRTVRPSAASPPVGHPPEAVPQGCRCRVVVVVRFQVGLFSEEDWTPRTCHGLHPFCEKGATQLCLIVLPLAPLLKTHAGGPPKKSGSPKVFVPHLVRVWPVAWPHLFHLTVDTLFIPFFATTSPCFIFQHPTARASRRGRDDGDARAAACGEERLGAAEVSSAATHPQR